MTHLQDEQSLPIDLSNPVIGRKSNAPRRSSRPKLLLVIGLSVAALILVGFTMVGNEGRTVAEGAASNDNGLPEGYNSVAAQATGTLGSLIGTSVPDESQRATIEAAIQSEINAAVQATFMALTPTVTPLPTNVPVAESFTTNNPVLGPEDAPITIVEFSDYNCGFCGRFHAQTLTPLLQHYGDLVRFVYREYPIIGGQVSADIGAAAQCAGEQDKYWEYSDLIWANRTSQERPEITGETLTTWANEVGLNFDQFLACLEEGRGFEVVIADFEAGRAYNITGTPTFFINGERFVGAQPLEAFQAIIDRQLLEMGIEPPERG